MNAYARSARKGSTMRSHRFQATAATAFMVASAFSSIAFSAPDINQHGLTGSYFNPATNGQGAQVEVFQDMFAPGQGYVQVSWFTFATSGGGQRWYTMGGYALSGQSSSALTIYQNTGGNFAMPPITNGVAVGSANLSFTACDQGMLNYNFMDGRVGAIPLTRLTKNVTCLPSGNAEPVNLDFGLSGNWYNTGTSGQGLMVEINNVSPVAFMAMYTYAINGVNLGLAGQRWITGQSTYVPGARAIPLTFYETTGGAFDQALPAPTSTPVGNGQLFFQTCTSATLQYQFNGGSLSGQAGNMPLVRVGITPRYCF
jgi:hypothetical protein